MQRLESVTRTGAPRISCGKHFLALWLLMALGFPGAAVASGGQSADDDTLVWLDDYQQALALAQETGRPLLVEFRCAP